MIQKEAAAKEAAAKQANNGMGMITAHFCQKDKFMDAEEAKQLYLVASSTCAATHGLMDCHCCSLRNQPFRKCSQL